MLHLGLNEINTTQSTRLERSSRERSSSTSQAVTIWGPSSISMIYSQYWTQIGIMSAVIHREQLDGIVLVLPVTCPLGASLKSQIISRIQGRKRQDDYIITLWGWDKMADILQVAFSNSFLHSILIQISPKIVPWRTISHHWFRSWPRAT